MPLIARLKLALASLLGTHYAQVVSAVDRAVTAFLIAFGAKAVASGLFSTKGIVDLSIWQTAALAGLAATLSAVKSFVMIWLTGTPALGSLVSSTLRARRDAGRKVEHKVPLRPTRVRARKATPRKHVPR